LTQIEQWTPSTLQPTLAPGTVHVWCWRHGDPNSPGEPDVSSLGPDELRRYRRFYFRADQLRFAASHLKMRSILAGYLQQPPASLAFSSGSGGKPRLVSAADPALEFNLSHSRSYGLLAVAHGLEVGVDVEEPRTIQAGMPKRYFSSAEVENLSKLEGDAWLSAFLRCWTRKEALLKAEGVGLRMPLDAFDVSLTADAPAALLAVRPPATFRHPWALFDVSPSPDAVAALAVSAQPTQISLFRYKP
jgi:4'-phosphopantetheinyl transferase